MHADGASAGQSLRVLIDGAPFASFQNGETVVRVGPGSHDLFVETADGTLGSLSRSIEVQSATSARVALWPQRTVRGRVRFDVPAAQLPPELTLGGITVIIAPGNLSVDTDADGNFVFARQPFDPEAVIAVDPDTIPRGFAPPAPMALGDGAPLEVLLKSARRVERQIFK